MRPVACAWKCLAQPCPQHHILLASLPSHVLEPLGCWVSLGAGASVDGCGSCGSCAHQQGCLRLLPLACADGVHPRRVIQGLCVLHILAAEPQVLSLAPSEVWAGPFEKLQRGWEEVSGQFSLCLLNSTLVESAFSRGLVCHFAFPCQCQVHTSGP